jgi:hypothetical protein
VGRQNLEKAGRLQGPGCRQRVGRVEEVRWLHRKKRLATFPSPAGMSLTEVSLGGNHLIIPI